MGSSSSKPRKGHEHPKHLPKVGTPANEQWEEHEHKENVFGSGAKMLSIAIIGMIAVIGVLILTL